MLILSLLSLLIRCSAYHMELAGFVGVSVRMRQMFLAHFLAVAQLASSSGELTEWHHSTISIVVARIMACRYVFRQYLSWFFHCVLSIRTYDSTHSTLWLYWARFRSEACAQGVFIPNTLASNTPHTLTEHRAGCCHYFCLIRCRLAVCEYYKCLYVACAPNWFATISIQMNRIQSFISSI